MAGLSKADLDQIRSVLEGGKRPRVMFTEAAGQIAGQVGQVVELGNPKDGDEWIVVKFGGDALPFSPADLAMPPRGGVPKRSAVVKPAEPPAEETTPGGRRPLAVGEDLIEPAQPSKPARQEPSVSEPAASAEPVAPAPRKATAARAPKVKPPAALTVTLAYTEGEWTVGATQGSKALAKPYVIKPAEALQFVGLLDVPGVHEAVEAILAAERDAAKIQAEKLRAELAEVEAKLAELGM
ncbi:MAG TPA: hypothetical protein VGF17_21515 [Phytomonospora sp.]